MKVSLKKDCFCFKKETYVKNPGNFNEEIDIVIRVIKKEIEKINKEIQEFNIDLKKYIKDLIRDRKKFIKI